MKKKNLFLSGLASVLLMSNGAGYVKSNAQAVIQPIDNGNTLNDLVEGFSYSSYEYKPYMVNCSNLVVAGKIKEESVGSKYTYCVFYMGVIETPYQSNVIGYYHAGATYTVSLSSTKSSTYEEAIETSIKSSVSCSMSAEESFLVGKIGYGVNASIETNVKASVKESTTISNTEVVTITDPIVTAGYYKYQRRATAKMYIVASYENNFKNKKYTYLGYNVYYEFENDLGTRLTRYTLNEDGDYVFADDISNPSFLRCL